MTKSERVQNDFRNTSSDCCKNKVRCLARKGKSFFQQMIQTTRNCSCSQFSWGFTVKFSRSSSLKNKKKKVNKVFCWRNIRNQTLQNFTINTYKLVMLKVFHLIKKTSSVDGQKRDTSILKKMLFKFCVESLLSLLMLAIRTIKDDTFYKYMIVAAVVV